MQRRATVLALLIISAALTCSLAAQDKDLAQGTTAIASSSESAKYAPDKAVDGNTATGWASLKEDPQWIRVDLGASYTVAKVVLNWGIASAKAYRVEISDDDTSWKKLASRSNMGAGIRTDELTGLSKKGRYLRVFCTAKSSGSTQYALRELSAFGAGEKPKPDDKKAKPEEAGAAPERKSGLFIDLGFGLPIPLGDSADVLKLGVFPYLGIGWQFPLGPGRLKLGLESGALVETTVDEDIVFAQYTSVCIPIGALAAYDIKVVGPLRAYLQLSGGYSATLVYYVSDALDDIGIWKPYFAGAAGLGFDLGERWTLSAGARYIAVFYDENAYKSLAPVLGVELRF